MESFHSQRSASASVATEPAAGIEHYKSEVLAYLTRCVEVTGAVFYSVDARLNAFDHRFHLIEGGRNDWYVSYYHRLDPFHPRRFADSPRSLITLRDIEGDYQRSEYYRDFFAPLGLMFETELFLRHRGAIVAGISLLRGRNRTDFNTTEVGFLRRVLPLVEAGYQGYLLDTDTGVGHCPPVELTPREAEVVELVCAGASNAEVGRALHISLPTVKSHLQRVYAKLEVRSRTQLIAAVHGRAPASAGTREPSGAARNA